MIAETTRIRQHDRTASRVVDGGALVIVIDERKLHSLNAVGTVVWENADGKTVAEIVDAVVERFAVDRATAFEDTRKFVQQLAELGALELEGEES